jgi:peptidoglycan-associated lipoprotein
MRKLHDEAYASERIVSDYEDAFREAGLGGIDKYAFGTREDERNNLNKLGDSAKRVKGGMLELSKAIAQVSVNIDDANQELSLKRAQSVVNYLVSMGIDQQRLTPVGYGEEKPVVVDENLHKQYPFLPNEQALNEAFINTLSPEQQEICHSLNRRTEFRVLKTTYNLY